MPSKSFNAKEFDSVKEVWNGTSSYANSFQIVTKGQKQGLWCDTNDMLVIPCLYSSITPIYEHDNGTLVLFQVFISRNDDDWSKDAYGVFDTKKRRFVFEPGQYFVRQIAYSLKGIVGFVVSSLSNFNTIGVINREGGIVCPFEYEPKLHNDIPDRDESDMRYSYYHQETILSYTTRDSYDKIIEPVYFVLAKQDEYYVFNIEGNQVLEKGYQRIDLIQSRIHQHDYCGIPWESNEVYFKVADKNGYGLLHERGSQIFPCIYDKLEYIDSMDIVITRKDGEYQIFGMNYDSK